VTERRSTAEFIGLQCEKKSLGDRGEMVIT